MIERLQGVIGAGAVRTGPDAARWAVRGAAPRAVVAPATVEEAAALLSLASAEGWTVELAGAGGWLDAGRPASPPDLVVTTERLAGISAYEPADLVASVRAGSTLGSVREALAAHGQWLPLDPPGGSTGTLGAVVAAGGAGPLRLGYGTPRDHVLGLQLVTGDGRVLELGGRVMKNVAGYDLVRLVVGSQGTLGLITRVDLRLRSLPAHDRTVVLAAPAAEPLLEAIVRVREAHLSAVALELLSPTALAALGRAGGRWELWARLQGNAEGVAEEEERTRALARGVGCAADVLDAAGGAAAWRALDQLEATAPLALRLADRPASLGETLALARELPGAEPLAVVAHAGDGIVRVLATAEQRAPLPSPEWASALEPLRAALAARGGTLILARGERALLDAFDPWGDVAPGALRLMRALKETFDPAGVLAPGRYAVR